MHPLLTSYFHLPVTVSQDKKMARQTHEFSVSRTNDRIITSVLIANELVHLTPVQTHYIPQLMNCEGSEWIAQG